MPRGYHIDWTSHEATIRAMVADGALTRDIAAAIGCCSSAVLRQLSILGLSISPDALAADRIRVMNKMIKDPAVNAKRAATLRKMYRDDPALAERMRARSVALWEKPGHRELISAKSAAYAQTPKGRAARVNLGKATKIPHIPEAYRDLYRTLMRRGDMRAPEACAMIKDQIAADVARERRRLAASQPQQTAWERTLAAAQAGTARIIDLDRIAA